MAMTTTAVYRWLLLVLHLLISAEELMTVICRRMMKLLWGSTDPCSFVSIRHEGSRVKRLPVHLGIVFVEEKLQVFDVVKIVAWSMAAGISCITIYDHKGDCKKSKATILRLLEEQVELLERNDQHRKCSSSSLKHCSNGANGSLMSGGGGGDCHQRLKTKLQIVGPEDGRQHLIEVTKQLCHRVVNSEIKTDDIIVPYVDAIIHEKDPNSDPDLVIKFGPVSSLLGFLPWHSRLTEIVSLPTHHQIDFTSFLAALNRFGYIEQRHGK